MKATAAFAGLGLAVGGALVVVLKYVVRPSVLAGIGTAHTGLPRRYTDYLPTDTESVLGGWTVALVLLAGPVVAVLLGLVVRLVARRSGTPTGPAACVPAGLVVGAVLAVLLHVVGDRLPHTAEFGVYSYSPLSSAAVRYGGGPGAAWWPLVLTGALVGLAVGALVAAAGPWWDRPRLRPRAG